jgi:hypothetical protein
VHLQGKVGERIVQHEISLESTKASTDGAMAIHRLAAKVKLE